jgi:hypothetical protein
MSAGRKEQVTKKKQSHAFRRLQWAEPCKGVILEKGTQHVPDVARLIEQLVRMRHVRETPISAVAVQRAVRV